jgi:hypothetical protein
MSELQPFGLAFDQSYPGRQTKLKIWLACSVIDPGNRTDAFEVRHRARAECLRRHDFWLDAIAILDDSRD